MQQNNKGGQPKPDEIQKTKATQPEESNKQVEEKPGLSTLNNPKISGGTSDKGSRDNMNDTIGNP